MIAKKAIAVLVTTTLAITLQLGCGGGEPATINGPQGAAAKAKILAKTGDGLSVPFDATLPSETQVTIQADGSSKSTARVRIESGKYKGQEAIVEREFLRLNP